MRAAMAILGTLVVLLNLTCSALCAAPTAVPPPCHQQHDDGQPKLCEQQTWADDAAKFSLPELAVTPVTIAVFHLVAPSPAAQRRLPAKAPPRVLRI
jgi:hypothetical protein